MHFIFKKFAYAIITSFLTAVGVSLCCFSTPLKPSVFLSTLTIVIPLFLAYDALLANNVYRLKISLLESVINIKKRLLKEGGFSASSSLLHDLFSGLERNFIEELPRLNFLKSDIYNKEDDLISLYVAIEESLSKRNPSKYAKDTHFYKVKALDAAIQVHIKKFLEKVQICMTTQAFLHKRQAIFVQAFKELTRGIANEYFHDLSTIELDREGEKHAFS